MPSGPERYDAPPSRLRDMPRIAVRGRLVRPRAGINHVLAYGQSLSSGWDGWPPLSLTPEPGLLMLGGSVRPGAESGPDWQPVGDARFQPLAATLQDPASGRLLDPATPGLLGQMMGETPLETALAEWRHRAAMPGEMQLLASSCGVGARTIEALAEGATPPLFNRLATCTSLARGIATARGLAYQPCALLFLQGEHNSLGLAGGTADRATYLAHLLRLHDTVQARFGGRDGPIALFLHQSGGDYASDSQAIAQAQLDAALLVPSIYLAAPVYPLPARGGHLDPNGYRWLGAQFAKVMHRVLTLGADFKPLHPVRSFVCGTQVNVDFHVPQPPLVFGRPFGGRERIAVPDRGFAVRDVDGAVPLRGVEINGPSSLRITLARPPRGAATLHYAGQSHHGGRGALHDSDPARARARFAALPDCPADDLAGRPYPLANWCVAFNRPLD